MNLRDLWMGATGIQWIINQSQWLDVKLEDAGNYIHPLLTAEYCDLFASKIVLTVNTLAPTWKSKQVQTVLLSPISEWVTAL